MQYDIKKTIVVDVLIMLFLLLMLVEEVTGLFDDEILGAVLIVLFVLHIIANKKCISASIKSFQENTIDKKNLSTVIVNFVFYGSMIICSLMAILSTDGIIDFDMDFDELYVFFVIIFVISFILHILLVTKSVEEIIREKLRYK